MSAAEDDGVYDRGMRDVPKVLLVLSFPAGAIAYAATVKVLEALGMTGDGRDILMLFIPLFVAGLAMMPFLIPFIDRKAKEDLAAIAGVQGEEPDDAGDDAPSERGER
jgi:hypothetical protein